MVSTNSAGVVPNTLLKARLKWLGDSAISDYNRAVELATTIHGDPPKLPIFCVDGTIADYNRAIELDPKQPRAYINRGFAKQAKGDVDGATVDYNRALELAAKLAKP
jgi:tetratricopeptide (TPR) repeat protein